MRGKEKKETRRSLILWCNPVDISREHGAFFDVGDAEEAGGDALEADGEAAVRGHAVAEGVEVEMERVGVHATTEHLLAVVGFFMDTLSAGGDLQTTHEEVERESQRRVLGVVHRIESTVLAREMGNEDEIASVFVICIFANCPFFLRSQIVFTAVVCFAEVVLEEDLVNLREFPCGYLLGKHRINGVQELEFVGAIAFYDSDDMAEESMTSSCPLMKPISTSREMYSLR